MTRNSKSRKINVYKACPYQDDICCQHAKIARQVDIFLTVCQDCTYLKKAEEKMKKRFR